MLLHRHIRIDASRLFAAITIFAAAGELAVAASYGTTGFTYSPVSDGSKLTGIAHSYATTGAISSFSYGHSPEGRITEWTRTTRPGATTDRYDFTYDAAGRMTEALLKNDSTGALLETFAYRFDKAGNRLVGQRGESVVGGTFNTANQLTATSAGGIVLDGVMQHFLTLTTSHYHLPAPRPASATANRRFSLTIQSVSRTRA